MATDENALDLGLREIEELERLAGEEVVNPEQHSHVVVELLLSELVLYEGGWVDEG